MKARCRPEPARSTQLGAQTSSANGSPLLALKSCPISKALQDAVLDAPTNWVSWDLDLRFRLHRFASHDREHAIQLQKARQALGLLQTETQLLLADAAVELESLVSVLMWLSDESLNHRPDDGSPTIADLVQEQIQEEAELLDP